MSHYAKAHENTEGAGDARPTALQIVEDEDILGRLTDKVFLVTGVSSGIGIETMRAMYATGGHVFGTVRNMRNGQAVVDDIKATTQGGKISLIEMNLDSLASAKHGAHEFLSQSKKLNVLVNNAGVMATPQGKTRDGFETQFGTNYLGHFYLFQLLKNLLLQSASSDFPSRVVSVSSFGHRSGEIRFDDYHFETEGSYNPWVSYGQAKTANIYFSNEIERRYGSMHLHSTSLHPGGVKTGLQVHVPELLSSSDTPEVRAYMKSAAQGAATQVYAALSKEWKNKGGKYLSNCVEEKPFGQGKTSTAAFDDGHAEWAYDEMKEKRLWTDSLKMVGLKDDQ